MPCSMRIRAASRETRNEPRAITSCWRSQSATVVSRSGFEIDRPALFTTMSMPPNASVAVRNAAMTWASSVTSATTLTATSGPPSSVATASAMPVDVGDHDARALRRQPVGDRLADPRPGPGDEGDLRRERLRLRQAGELRLFERPVLDPELLGLRDRGVGRERLGAAHDVDRVDVELAGDPRGLLVRTEREHPDPRHEDDRRVGAAHRRAVGRRVPLVVGGGTRRDTPRGARAAGPRPSSSVRGRRQVEDDRPDLRPQEVVRARGAQLGQPRVLGPGQEVEDDVRCRCSGRPAGGRSRRARGSAGTAPRPARVARSRSAARSPATTRPNGSARPCSAMNASAVRMISSDRASHSVGCVAPGGDPVAAEDRPDRLGLARAGSRRCRGRAGSRAVATAPRRPGRRSSAGSAPRRRRPSRARSRSRGGGGRRGRRRPARASRCRSTAPRRPGRAGSSRTRRPSRPRARRPDRPRPASAAGRAGAPPARPRSAFRGRRRSP